MKGANYNPPKLAIKFLRWFSPPQLLEGIEGDLVEKYFDDEKVYGPKKARIAFVLSVLRFFTPAILLRNKLSPISINTTMFKSHYKISYRNILRHKAYSAINIFGLAIGIAACLLTLSFIRFELTFDDFHPDTDRTYRVDQTMIWTQEGGTFGSTGPALAQALTDEYPEIEEVVRVNTAYSSLIRYSDEKGNVISFNEENVLAADSTFFDFFGFKLKEGNPENALKGINNVVISDIAAKRFFGDQPALGKILQFGDQKIPVMITGVTEPQPENSHFHFDFLLSIYSNPAIKRFEWSWVWTQVVTYIKLRPAADKSQLEAKLLDLGERRVRPSFERYGMNYDQMIQGKGGWHFYLKPVRDIRLYSTDSGNRLGPVGNITYVKVFGAIGIFVLLIAAINFINLSTARCATRAKEIGIKKTIGASRNSLIWQFQVESILISVAATALALFLAELLKIFVQNEVGINFPNTAWTDKKFLPLIPFIPLVIGILAGAYPSFYLSAFNPEKVLKGKATSGMGNSGFRNLLVGIQFTISIALIIGTTIAFQQLKFFSNTNLGFDKENVLVVDHADKLGEHIDAFKDEVLKFPGVSDATIAMDVPGGGYYEDTWTMEGTDSEMPVTSLKVDHRYSQFMRFELAAGRFFDSANIQSDKTSAIPNETLVRLFGLTPQEALGKKIIYPDQNINYEIIGVVKDFNYHSLHQPIQPIVLINTNANMWGDMRVIAVRFQSKSIAPIMEKMRSKWKEVLDDVPFSYAFLDQRLEGQYSQEQRLGKLLGIFSGLSIAVAVIGLIGLVSYSVEVRKREIGIRKVFGASIAGIILLLNRQYVKLVVVAMLIASPIAWWLIAHWLQTFAYRVRIHWMVFLLAGSIELMIAFLCVGYLSLKAARLNPTTVLKDE
ncbi:MAG TPA: ABC transporter permease [Cyclobacteriaceae bacterium]|nr:ABC transporter permease [Cyclobacteriaceae bacterium]